jgi:hypothetical protein
VITFNDLPLYMATYHVYQTVEKPGSDDWISSNAKSAYKLVLWQMVDDEAWSDAGLAVSMEQVVRAWRHLRKVKKLRLLCRVASLHGSRCFYADRGVGPCSDGIDLDRILPGSRGGHYTLQNCIVACSAHNRSRGDSFLEDYLARRQVATN